MTASQIGYRHMRVLLVHVDGKLPNLALMKLSHWHKSLGDEVSLVRNLSYLPEESFDRVYISAIFQQSRKILDRLSTMYPEAILGGTGSENQITVEDVIGTEYEHYDYSPYKNYPFSLGFTSRGCRLACKFCVVPKKEGRPRSVNTLYDIWRGDPFLRKVCLLDNDFFGQEQWRERVHEIIDGRFQVSFNQGINIRLITEESATWLAKIPYYDDQFKVRRLYTAWDNLKDESIFFRGVDLLEKAGVPPQHILVYMLVGYDPSETWERIFYRFHKMVERGVLPYPMVYNNTNKALKEFQRWVVRRYYQFVPWHEFARKSTYISSDKDLMDIYLQIGHGY